MKEVSLGNIQALLKLIGEKGAEDRLTKRLADGSLADVLDRRWDYSRRAEIRRLAFVETAPLVISPERPLELGSYFGSRASIWRGPVEGGGLEGDEEIDARATAIKEIDLRLVELKTHSASAQKVAVGQRSRGRGRSHFTLYVNGEQHVKSVKAENPNHLLLGLDFGVVFVRRPDLYPEAWKGLQVFWSGTILRGPGLPIDAKDYEHFASFRRFGAYTEWNNGRVEVEADWLEGNASGRVSALLHQGFGGQS